MSIHEMIDLVIKVAAAFFLAVAAGLVTNMIWHRYRAPLLGAVAWCWSRGKALLTD